MTNRLLLRTAAASAAVALGVLAAPAHASTDISIGHTEVADDGTVSVLLDVQPADRRCRARTWAASR